MKARHRRGLLVAAAVALLGLATWLVLAAFQKNLVFFYTPTQVLAGEAPRGRAFRIGGMVEAGSLQRDADGLGVSFVVSDTVQRVPVRFRGALPDLFKEGKGVVAQGRLAEGAPGFVADEVLAKHDENYMPPEAAHAVQTARDAVRAQPGRAAPGGTP